MNKPLRGLDVSKENVSVNQIFDERDPVKKKALVIQYINADVMAVKKRPLFLEKINRLHDNNSLDAFVANITLAGRGLKTIS